MIVANDIIINGIVVTDSRVIKAAITKATGTNVVIGDIISIYVCGINDICMHIGS